MSLLSRFKNRLFCDLAIDLGTANTLVYLKGRGIIVQEPSMVVINRETGKVEAVGKRAKEMLGKTTASILVIKPMRNGVIADFELAEKMLDFFIKRSTRNRGFFIRSRIVIGIPSGITHVEKRAVKDVAIRAKASELSADIIDRGIILTGGGALLKNMDKRIQEETQLPVFINDDPLTTVVLGAGKMLDNLDLLKKMSLE